jgi:hypothetical protein
VFLFSLQIFPEIFFIVRRNERDMIKDVYRSLCKEPIILVRFSNELEFSRQIFEKSSNTKFHKNPSRRNRVFPCGQTGGPKDRHYQANSGFRNFENVPKNDTKMILRSVVASI